MNSLQLWLAVSRTMLAAIKKCILALSAAAVLSMPSAAEAGAFQIPQDKQLHMYTTTAISYGLKECAGDSLTPFERWALTAAFIGGSKELYDAQAPHHSADWKDLAADAVGAAAAEFFPVKARGKYIMLYEKEF